MEDRTENRTAAAKLSFMRSRLARKNAGKQTTDINIKTAYDNAKFDIASLVNLLEMKLDKTPANLNWGHVGDLKHLRQSLIETLSGMTGMAEHTIRESLEEIRMDAEILKQERIQE